MLKPRVCEHQSNFLFSNTWQNILQKICKCRIALDLKSKEYIRSWKQLHLYKQNYDTEDIHALLSIHWSFPIYPERERKDMEEHIVESVKKMLVWLLITSVFQFHHNYIRETQQFPHNYIRETQVNRSNKQQFALTLPGTGLEVHQASVFSGAGDAFSRRRGTLSSTPTSAFISLFVVHFKIISLLVVHFKVKMLRSRSLLQIGEKDTRRSLCRRYELWFFVFTVVLPMALPNCPVCSPAVSREGSLATALLKFTGMFPDELHPGCAVDLTRALQPLMERRSQHSDSCFPSLGSETAKLPRIVPFHSYGARVQGNSSPDPNLIGRSSLSPPPSELPLPLVCAFLNGRSAYLRQTSLSTSVFDGHSACFRELVSPPT
ncbi:unnamed protein product [Eruca vesicaria subsp. sativa]|uniref:Uncharacterized protein n=1 Tax=Eruca vesicaria subsp. sativa TaxID=29727 RepID=A0ABC8JCT0_ERUVS|nr:unnamed protein product [Eruca vesicaria subsp. sativa]